MNPFFTGALVGAAVGIFVATFALSPSFRDGIISRVKGTLGGDKPKRIRKEVVKEPPKESKRVYKKHVCMKCGETGTIEDMEEANFGDSKATGWIHTHCLKSLEK